MHRFLLAAVIVTLAEPAPARVQDSTPIQWQTDRAKAFAEARKTGKPLWVLFR